MVVQVEELGDEEGGVHVEGLDAGFSACGGGSYRVFRGGFGYLVAAFEEERESFPGEVFESNAGN